MSTGAELIAAERQRQIDVEGWTPEHDAGYRNDDLTNAARAYLEQSPRVWPWALFHYKPTPDDRVRELTKAGALIAAEIDRLNALSLGASS